MKISFVFAIALLASMASGMRDSVLGPMPPTEHHIIRHDHEINCKNCYCGHNGIERALHECSSDRDIVLCPPTILKRVCYRCSCHSRIPVTPSPLPSHHAMDGKQDDDDHEHEHADDETHDDVMTPSPDEDDKDMDMHEKQDEMKKSSPSKRQNKSTIPTVTPSPKSCATFERGGGGGNTMFDVDLFQTQGKFLVSWQMDSVPDKVDIFYEGKIIYTTTVPVTGRGSAYVHYSGKSTVVTIWVSSPIAGTGWFMQFGCPSKH